MHAAEARSIVKSFPIGAEAGSPQVQVLHGIDLAVATGELTMLVGPSGCGKTTLLSILSGTMRPSGGEARVLGERLSDMADAQLVRFRRRNIGFIFQQYNLLPTLTAAENAAIALVADGVPLAEGARRARMLLDRLGMGPHADKKPNMLSGGQQQRVAIARALVHAPALVVCDEPTAALDAKSGRDVMDLLKAASADAARAVLVVTHDNRIFDQADRIVEMEDGRVVSDTAARAAAPLPVERPSAHV